MKDSVKQLTIIVEAALLRELRKSYREINTTFFKDALRPALIALSDGTSRLGLWVSEERTIEVSRTLVLEQPWGHAVEVLKHEMAHQYVHEVLGQRDETAHGRAFRQVCERMGIDPRASGLPKPAREKDEDSEEDRVLGRVSRLLALAESGNANEAQAAMAAAQRLMLKYNIDLSEAESRGARQYAHRHVGKPTGRVSVAERMIAMILCEHFFVEVIWIPVYRPYDQKHGTVLEACGTDTNLEMAEYVHGFLTQAGDRLWREHKASQMIESNRDRRTFIAGVMMGFHEKLETERKKHQEQGLVWVGDAELHDFYRKRHPHIRLTRFGGRPLSEAHEHGRKAGKSLVLFRPVAEGASGRQNLLPSRAE